MSELPIADDKVLAFDLNQCSDREFCEVFHADIELARNLIEYRQEVLHIFKFDQLLKLRGMSRELIAEWTSPKAQEAANPELQGALGLQVDQPEPLQSLLQALSRQTGATGCLMAARDGALVLNTAPGEPAYETLAAVVSQFVRPVQEDMLQMKLGTADAQVVSYEQNELMFLPASAFYLAVLQPAGKITTGNVKLWKTLAAEVRKRVPPRMVIDNHAKVTDSDIAFDCPKCYLRLVVDRAGAGFSFPCPRCKHQVTVPSETTSFSSFIEPKNLVVDSKGA